VNLRKDHYRCYNVSAVKGTNINGKMLNANRSL